MGPRRILLALLTISFTVNHEARAGLRFEIQLSDLDGNGVINQNDVKTAINLCGTSYQGGCTIVFPRQTIGFSNTLVIGGGSSYPAGITFRGQGSCSAA